MTPRHLFISFFFLITIFTFTAITKYVGVFYIFIWFTITSTTLLFYGFRKNAIFFDTFIGIFLWLGFWLKTTVRIIFLDSQFSEGLGQFIIPADTFDEALFISGIAFLALIIASHIRERFIFNYPEQKEKETSGLFLYYENHRAQILVGYILLFIFIGVSNFYLGIYQRGEITQTTLPFGLNGIYKWLLLFGISSFAALILKYEVNLQKKPTYFVPILTLVEACITNISLLSRGMILNSSSLGFGMLQEFQTASRKINKKFWFILAISFIVLFLTSVILVNKLRTYTIHTDTIHMNMNMNGDLGKVKILFLDRWVGIEGMIATSNSEQKGWALFKEAISEKYDEHNTSFYDLNLIHSPYLTTDTSKHHYMSLPGFIAFFYYPGSIVFLFCTILVLGLAASLIELTTYTLGDKNLILSALIAQVVAYRYAHFGYVPAQSYLLFGSIFLTIFLVFGTNKFLLWWYLKKKVDILPRKKYAKS